MTFLPGSWLKAMVKISVRAALISLACATAIGIFVGITFSRDSDRTSAAAPSGTKSPPSRGSSSGSRPTREQKPADPGRRYFKLPDDSEWKRLATTITPATARDLLEQSKLEDTNIDTRAEKAWLIINLLCQNGYTREAWELIDPEQGEIRNKGLGGFFRDADLPKTELLALTENMSDSDRSSSLFGYWSRFSPEEFAKLDMSETPIRSHREMGAFRRAIEEVISQAYDPKNPEASKWLRHDALVKAVELANGGTFPYSDLKTILSKDPSKDGFTYWEAIKNVSPELRATQTQGMNNYNGTDSMIIRAMAVQDPRRTMEMTLVPESHESKYIHIAMGQWLEKDFTNADKWVQEHVADFTPDQQERTAVAYIRAQVARGEFEAAEKWLPYIKNEKWRDAVAWHASEIRRKLAPPEVTPGK